MARATDATHQPRRGHGEPAALEVLFVCTANISRSPYAERRARQALGGSHVHVASAGVPGYPGREMDPVMAELLARRGGDPSAHLSRSVDDEVLDDADLIVVFEFAQHMRLLDAFPRHARRIVGMGQLATAAEAWVGARRAERWSAAEELVEAVVRLAGPNSASYDVADPYRQGSRAAQLCADQIDAHLDIFLPVLAGTPLPPLSEPWGNTDRKPRRWLW